MSRWNKLSLLAALLPGLAGAADPAMMDLIMPDAKVVMEINIHKIVNSPIGQAMATQIKAELEKTKPQWQQQVMAVTGFDFSKLSDVLIAGTGSAKDAPTLIIVRGSFGPAVIQSLKASGGVVSEYQGVPLVASVGKNHAVVGFLDDSLAVMGQAADVTAAIHRRGHGAGLPAALAEKVKRYNGHYDTWMASAGRLWTPADLSSAAGSGSGAKAAQLVERLESVDGGLRFSPDFEVSAEIVARTEKDATGMAEGLRWLSGAFQASQAKNPRANSVAQNMKFEVQGRRILFSVRVPEAEMRAALQQRVAAFGQTTTATQPAPVRPAPSSGMPPPPPGTIRIQSSPSDMGTQLIPIDKDH